MLASVRTMMSRSAAEHREIFHKIALRCSVVRKLKIKKSCYI